MYTPGGEWPGDDGYNGSSSHYNYSSEEKHFEEEFQDDAPAGFRSVPYQDRRGPAWSQDLPSAWSQVTMRRKPAVRRHANRSSYYQQVPSYEYSTASNYERDNDYRPAGANYNPLSYQEKDNYDRFRAEGPSVTRAPQHFGSYLRTNQQRHQWASPSEQGAESRPYRNQTLNVPGAKVSRDRVEGSYLRDEDRRRSVPPNMWSINLDTANPAFTPPPPLQRPQPSYNYSQPYSSKQPHAAGQYQQAYQPATPSYQQSATAYQSSAPTYQPAYQPSAAAYKPSAAAYQPSAAPQRSAASAPRRRMRPSPVYQESTPPAPAPATVVPSTIHAERLPGGGERKLVHLQYNSPLNMYTTENVADAMEGQTGYRFAPTDSQHQQQQGQQSDIPAYLHSATARMVQEEDQKRSKHVKFAAAAAPQNPIQSRSFQAINTAAATF